MWKIMNIGLIFLGSFFILDVMQSMIAMQKAPIQAFDFSVQHVIFTMKNDLLFAMGLTLLVIGIIREMKA